MEQLNLFLKEITIRQEQPPKEVTMNTKLMKDLLAYAPEFRFWKYKSFDQLFHLVKLNSSDAYSVVNSFNSTMTSPKGPSYSVQCVIRVENPFLLAQFHLKRIQSNDEGRYASVTELFHGTHGKSVLPICRNNFNWRLTGTAKGTKFGRGISFSPRSDYSKHFTSHFYFNTYPELETDGYGRVMFKAKVLKGTSHIGEYFTRVPVEGYDTTTNSKFTVYVKYQDFEFYPEYILLIK